MAANGQLQDASTEAHVLHWPARLVTAEDLRHSLNGHRELVVSARTIITPLAGEELRTRGIRVSRQLAQTPAEPTPVAKETWGYAQERPHPLVQSAVQALKRDGVALKELSANTENAPWRWAQVLAACVKRGECRGGVVFCRDPGLVCCVANKLAGLRAVAVLTVAEAARATLTVAANLVAVEMPGRTYFEVRQILRTLCRPGDWPCPPDLACTLGELDGHAHR